MSSPHSCTDLPSHTDLHLPCPLPALALRSTPCHSLPASPLPNPPRSPAPHLFSGLVKQVLLSVAGWPFSFQARMLSVSLTGVRLQGASRVPLLVPHLCYVNRLAGPKASQVPAILCLCMLWEHAGRVLIRGTQPQGAQDVSFSYTIRTATIWIHVKQGEVSGQSKVSDCKYSWCRGSLTLNGQV